MHKRTQYRQGEAVRPLQHLTSVLDTSARQLYWYACILSIRCLWFVDKMLDDVLWLAEDNRERYLFYNIYNNT